MQSVSINLLLNIPVIESYLDRGLGHSVDLQIFSSVVGELNDCFLLEDQAQSFFSGNFYR